MISHMYTEGKGTDVNVASLLLIDCLENNIDAAIVISNDSDLAYPIKYCKQKISIGIINPGGKSRYLAGALKKKKIGMVQEGTGINTGPDCL